jgi:ubiquinone/menaquinone biosynthesis C-methylase UbiE
MMAKRSLLRRAYDATYGRLFAACYDPVLSHSEEGELGEHRDEVIARAAGRVLEIGAGTGLNLAHYRDGVTELVLSEPFDPMAAKLRAKLTADGHGARVVDAAAEQLPFEADSFDVVVSTLVLCTVDDQEAALNEVARVLRPGGRLLFIEHVRASEERLARWQDRLHGPWFAFGHGCHCNRDTEAAIERSPLGIESIERRQMTAVPPLVRPMIMGSALLHG